MNKPECFDEGPYTSYCHKRCKRFEECGRAYDPNEWLEDEGMDRETYEAMMHSIEKDD